MAKNYSTILLETRRALKEAGIQSAQLDARELLCAATGKSREQLVRDYGIYAADETLEKIKDLVRRRLQGEPLAYLTGSWEFYGMELAITPDVLIPRDDTMVLAQAAVGAVRAAGPGARVMDLCTGSGCVGLAVARQVPECRAVLGDISPEALQVTRQNARRYDQNGHVSCVRVDASKVPPSTLGTFHVIACNPPYIPTRDWAELDASVKNYEPRLALDGGADGLDFYRTVPKYWKKALKPGGWLLMECGIGQSGQVAELMTEYGFSDLSFLRDTQDIPRVVAGTLGKKKENQDG